MVFITGIITKYKKVLVIVAGLAVAVSLAANYAQYLHIESLKTTNTVLTFTKNSLTTENKNLKTSASLNASTWSAHSSLQLGHAGATTGVDQWHFSEMQSYYQSEIARLTNPPALEVPVAEVPEGQLGLTHRPTEIGYDALWRQYCTLYTNVQCELYKTP